MLSSEHHLKITILHDDGVISRLIKKEDGIHRSAIGCLGFNPYYAAKEFLSNNSIGNGDDLDFLVFFTNYAIHAVPKWASPAGALTATSTPVHNTVEGIGIPPHDYRAGVGTRGRLKRIVCMNTLHHPAPVKDRFSWFLWRIAHEIGHQWLAHTKIYLGPRTEYRPSDRMTDSLLHCHWSRFLSVGRSPMIWQGQPNRPCSVQQLAARRFSWQPLDGGWQFSDLDLYLMGLAAPDEVAPFFLVLHAEVREADLAPEVPFTGQLMNRCLGHVVQAMGERTPDHHEAQREFRGGFILVTRDRSVTPEEKGFVAKLASAFPEYWSQLTRGRSRFTVISGTQNH
jgi:hypothetical protein